jgi:glutaminyl-tRNA synthetase
MSNFLTEIIEADLAADTHDGRVVTRFPPEPNGYLHIGHAKSICLNFGLAQQYSGACHLRFDDTNPSTEDVEYVDSIKDDVRWLGFEWSGEVRFASDYFERMADWARWLIERDLAYVDFSSVEDLREMRGSVSQPGRPSVYRYLSAAENLAAFEKMKKGEYDEGECVLRAKIDLESPNILMRDPLLYRIRKETHHRTGDTWCIYPMYDFAHCLEDAIEGVTHSICTLEFQNNRELYDWFIAALPVPHEPKQYEMARLALPNTVLSKRKLIELVQEGHVWGWDDPRMPSLAGIRRRGVPAEALRQFCAMIGVAKANSLVDWGKFEFAMRDVLNSKAPRVMAVLDPIKLTLTNVSQSLLIQADLWPHDLPQEETRSLSLGANLLIERGDFAADPPKGWRRLAPGTEVRLRYGWVVRCDEVIRDATGRVIELRASADLATLNAAPQGRKVRGTIHWLNAEDAVSAKLRLINPLFLSELPGSDENVDYRQELNPDSLQIIEGAFVEPHAAACKLGERFQFERTGYFYRDPADSEVVFNRIVSLRDSFAQKQPIKPAPKAKPRQAKSAPGPLVPEALRGQVAALCKQGLNEADAVRLCRDETLCGQWESAVAAGADAAAAAKLLLNDLRALRKSAQVSSPLNGSQITELLGLFDAGRVARSDRQTLLEQLLDQGGVPEAVARELGMLDRKSDFDIEAMVAVVLAEHPQETERFRGGEQRLIGFFVGACMRASQGRADAKTVQAALRKALS